MTFKISNDIISLYDFKRFSERSGIVKIKAKSRVLCALLFFVLTLTLIMLVPSAAGSNDYSSPSVALAEQIYADELLEDYVDGITLSDVEADYLRTQSTFVLSYNSAIPSSEIEADYEGGVLTVVAKEYVYTASNGTVVIWKPISATVYEETKELNAPSYKAEFSVSAAVSGDSVRVKYTADFIVPESTVGGLVNFAYDSAFAINERLKEYEDYLIKCEEYNEYLARLAEYNKYLAYMNVYREKSLEREKYLEEFAAYTLAKQEYDEYLVLRKQYESELLKYTEYLAYAETHAALIEAYKKYEEKIATVNMQLDIVTRAQKPYNSRTVYAAIMGDTVTSVIDRKGDIIEYLKQVNASVDDVEYVIDLADSATRNLRVLLKDFFGFKNSRDRYAYYVTNYDALRNNFANLLKALDNLYNISAVRAIMEAQEKEVKYIILVAQLYYMANALSDDPIASYDGTYYFNSSYKIGNKYPKDEQYSPYAVLGNQEFVQDKNNAEPLSGGYPSKVAEPEMEEVAEPVMPTPVKEPVPPSFVAEPTEPDFVAEPTLVEKPETVREHDLSEQEEALVKAYNDGVLTARSSYTGGDITVTREIISSKVFCGAVAVTVTYFDKEYDSIGEQKPLYCITVDKNTAVDYRGNVPLKLQDADYTYVHSGWTDGEGRDVDLSAIGEDIKLYPKFSAVKKNYKTWWVVNGGEPTEKYPGIPTRPNDEYYYYIFERWDETKNPDTMEATCVAVFEKFPIVETVYGPAKIIVGDGKYTVDLTDTNDSLSSVDIQTLITQAAGVGGIDIAFKSGDILSFSYLEVLNLNTEGIHTVSLEVFDNTYVLAFYSKEGSAVSSEVRATVSAECNVSDPANLVLYYRENGEKKFIRNTYADGRVTFSAAAGTYYAGVAYNISPVVPDSMEMILSTSLAAAGDTVRVSLDINPGIRVDRVYFVGQDNVKHYIDGMSTDGKILTVFGSFKMPAQDITVGVEYMQLLYTVKFESDGKIISTEKYNYGDTVSVPPNPIKALDEKYSYKFVGWIPSVEPVSRDVVYKANYETIPLPPKSNDNMKLTPLVLKLILLLYVGGSCFVGLVIPSAVLTVVLVIKYKKQCGRHKDKKRRQ